MDVQPILKPVRERCRAHLAFVGGRPCCINCCMGRPVQVHHLTHVQPKARGLKGGDQWTLPLCMRHHSELHAHYVRGQDGNTEADWWRGHGIDPIRLALDLWSESHGEFEPIAEAPLLIGFISAWLWLLIWVAWCDLGV